MKRVKVKLDIHLDGVDSTPETDGYEFVVCEHPFVVHKTIKEQNKGEGWSVTEPVTGTSILNYSAQTRKQAVEAATAKIESQGKDAVAAAIERQRQRAAARQRAQEAVAS